MTTVVLPTTTHAAVWTNVPTTDPVAFIRIDDGYAGNDDPAAAGLVEAGLVVNPCITYYAASSGAYPPVAGDPHVAYLRRFAHQLDSDSWQVHSHYKTHVHLPGLAYTTQYDDLGKASSWLARPEMFGATPRLFAPPYGEWDDNTRLAARARGYQVMMRWTHDRTQIATKPLRPGDVILLHFDANLYPDLLAAQSALAAAGLAPARLEDYLS